MSRFEVFSSVLCVSGQGSLLFGALFLVLAGHSPFLALCFLLWLANGESALIFAALRNGDAFFSLSFTENCGILKGNFGRGCLTC